MDNPHNNIKTLCHAYEVMKRPPAVGLQVGSVPQEPAFTEMAELRKLIMKNARLLQPEQLVSGGTDEERVLKAGTTIRVCGITVTLSKDLPVHKIPKGWELIED